MKKAIKIALIILITASMLFVLTGCGEKETKKENIADNEKEPVIGVENSEEEVDESKEEPEKQISIGKWNGNTYENDFLGLKFNLPTGWKYSSEKEIAEMMNIGSELLNDDQKAMAELSKLNTVHYMVVNDPSTGNNASILTEKVLMDVTEEFYINQLKTQLEAVESINYQIGATSKENIAGKEFEALTVTASMSGINLTQKYYIYKMDKYFVGIIVTSTTGESGINSIINCFE